MTGKLLKFHSIGGTTVIYAIVVNCEYFRNFFGSGNAHVFASSRYCGYWLIGTSLMYQGTSRTNIR